MSSVNPSSTWSSLPPLRSRVSNDPLDIDSDPEIDDTKGEQPTSTQGDPFNLSSTSGTPIESFSTSFAEGENNAPWAAKDFGVDLQNRQPDDKQEEGLERIEEWKATGEAHGMRRYYFDMKQAYQQSLEASGVVLDASTLRNVHNTSLAHQGNDIFYSEENLKKRYAIRNDSRLLDELEGIWLLLPKIEEKKPKKLVEEPTAERISPLFPGSEIFANNSPLPQGRRGTVAPTSISASLRGNDSELTSAAGHNPPSFEHSSTGIIEMMDPDSMNSSPSDSEEDTESEVVYSINFNTFRAVSAHVFRKLIPAGTMTEFTELVKEDFLRACQRNTSMLGASMISAGQSMSKSIRNQSMSLSLREQQENIADVSSLKLTKQRFIGAMLDIVDVWTESISLGEAVGFARQVLRPCAKKVATLDPEVPYDLRVAFNKDFAKRQKLAQKHAQKDAQKQAQREKRTDLRNSSRTAPFTSTSSGASSSSIPTRVRIGTKSQKNIVTDSKAASRLRNIVKSSKFTELQKKELLDHTTNGNATSVSQGNPQGEIASSPNESESSQSIQASSVAGGTQLPPSVASSELATSFPTTMYPLTTASETQLATTAHTNSSTTMSSENTKFTRIRELHKAKLKSSSFGASQSQTGDDDSEPAPDFADDEFSPDFAPPQPLVGEVNTSGNFLGGSSSRAKHPIAKGLRWNDESFFYQLDSCDFAFASNCGESNVRGVDVAFSHMKGR